MSWRVGLFRLWLLGSAVWIAYSVWRSDLSCPLALAHPALQVGPWCTYQNLHPGAYYGALILRTLAVPALALVAFYAGRWAIAGFNRRDKTRISN